MPPDSSEGGPRHRDRPTATNAAAAKRQVHPQSTPSRLPSSPSRASALERRLQVDPDPATAQSVDRAWLHLVEAGLVASGPDDLVTRTLSTVLEAAQVPEPHVVVLPPVMTLWWAMTVPLPPRPASLVLCGDGTSVAEPHACAVLAPALARRHVAFSCVGSVVFELLEAIAAVERGGST